MRFNAVCCIDLKEWVKGKKYILYAVEEFLCLTKCKVLDGKDADTVVKALIEIWVIGQGCSPRMLRKYFFLDRGMEFMNSKMYRLCADCMEDEIQRLNSIAVNHSLEMEEDYPGPSAVLRDPSSSL